MKSTPLGLGSSLLFLSMAFAVPASTLAGGEIDLLYGLRTLDLEVGVDDADDQQGLGLMLTLGSDWPVSLAIDIFQSEENGAGSYTGDYYGVNYAYTFTDLKAEVTEVDIGVRKFFGSGEKRLQGYVGGGAAYGDIEFTASGDVTVTPPGGAPTPFIGERADGDGFGFFVNGGLSIRASRRIRVGVDARFSVLEAEVTSNAGDTFFDDDFDIGGSNVAVFVGFRWD
jgi:hypothetical protein